MIRDSLLVTVLALLGVFAVGVSLAIRDAVICPGDTAIIPINEFA